MNPFHAVPPVWSPISLGAIGKAFGAGTPAVEALRAALRSEFSCRDVTLTASGTSSLTLALRSVARGSERPRIALPAYACFDLATAADGADAVVRLYDLDPTTLGPERASYRMALAAGVDAVVLVHLFGVPVDPDFVREARAVGATVIDDAAQGQGGSIGGTPLGSLGDLGVLSFGRGKGRTGGGGGALLAASEIGVEATRRVASLVTDSPRGASKLPAMLLAQWLLGRPGWYRIPSSVPWLRLGETIYHEPKPVEAIRPGSAAVVLGVTSLLIAEWHARTAAATRWRDELRGTRGVELIVPPAASTPGWLRFPVILSNELRARVTGESGRRLGVMPGYPLPLRRLDPFSRRVQGESSLAGADRLSQHLVTLPTHSRVGERDRAEILRLIRE